ncbi:MAG: hypothetical protein HQK78_19870, partial [Desulfobacterales bacterium]|nr:hypothetical protein [Desulfobacterales bacterium]
MIKEILEMIKNDQIAAEAGLYLIKKIKEDQPQSKIEKYKEIAVIGISAKLPDAENIYEFWDNLSNGKDSITEIPKNRWEATHFNSKW